jgi:putative phage-type endonuclease
MIRAITGVETDYGTHEAWLQSRRSFIGASESPILFGVGYSSQSPTALAMAKLGMVEPGEQPGDEETEAMRWGTRLQDTIAAEFSERSSVPVKSLGQFTVVRSAEKPYIGATLDGYAEDPLSVVELKNVGAYNARDWEADEPPLRVNVQVQHQMFCTGADRAYVVALLGGNRLTWHVVYRHERFIAALVERIDQFWGLIQEGKLPPVDGSEATANALRAAYRACNGEAVPMPPEAEQWDTDLVKAKEEIKRWEAVKTEAENKIRSVLGEAEMGVLASGVAYTAKVTTVHHKAKEAYTSEYRALRRKEPKR